MKEMQSFKLEDVTGKWVGENPRLVLTIRGDIAIFLDHDNPDDMIEERVKFEYLSSGTNKNTIKISDNIGVYSIGGSNTCTFEINGERIIFNKVY